MKRQAIQALFTYVTYPNARQNTLPVVHSVHQQCLKGRSYTLRAQVLHISALQRPTNGLASLLAYHAGLRAHELLTLRPVTEQPVDRRPALATKFQGMKGTLFTVKGKGGLVREVMIPFDLSRQLAADLGYLSTKFTEKVV